MSYFNQTILAQAVIDGLTVIIKEGLNTKADLELRIEVPKALHDLYNKGEYVYDQIDELFFSTDTRTGQCRFFSDSENHNGFGGATYNLPMRDGSIVTLKGPWASRCSVMNRAGFTPSKEVNIESVYNMASAMTIERINELILEMGYVCVPEQRADEWDLGYDIITLDELNDRIYIKCCEMDSPNSPDFENLLSTELAKYGVELY